MNQHMTKKVKSKSGKLINNRINLLTSHSEHTGIGYIAMDWLETL